MPRVALANASREALRMADVVEEMLKGSRELLRRDDNRLAAELRRMAVRAAMYRTLRTLVLPPAISIVKTADMVRGVRRTTSCNSLDKPEIGLMDIPP